MCVRLDVGLKMSVVNRGLSTIMACNDVFRKGDFNSPGLFKGLVALLKKHISRVGWRGGGGGRRRRVKGPSQLQYVCHDL